MIRATLASLFVLALAFTVAFYADRSQAGSSMKITLEEMLDKDPEAVAKAALDKGDHRLLAVMSYSTSAPGVDDQAMDRLGYVVIEGTSDVIEDLNHLVFNLTARKYAARYNRFVVEPAYASSPRRWSPTDQWPPPLGPWRWESWKKVLAHPMDDAKAALQRGDHRLMAVQVDEFETPGVELDFSAAEKRFGIVLIDDGDGSFPSTYWQGNYLFKTKARQYAAVYNAYIVEHASSPNP